MSPEQECLERCVNKFMDIITPDIMEDDRIGRKWKRRILALMDEACTAGYLMGVSVREDQLIKADHLITRQQQFQESILCPKMN